MTSVVRPGPGAGQLVCFRDGEKLIEPMEPGEVITFATIEKSFLPDVDIKESKEGAERKTLRQKFQFPPATDSVAADPGVAPGKFTFGRDARFPVRVAVMFFDKDFHRRKSVVVHL